MGWTPGKVTLDPAKLTPITAAKLKSLGAAVPIPNIDFLSNPLVQPLHVINPGALPNQTKDT